MPSASSRAATDIAVGEDRLSDTHAFALLEVAGTPVGIDVGPVVYRYADPARGELRRPVAAVPQISVVLDDEVEYARAGVPFERTYNVRLHNATASARGVTAELNVPAGLKLDSLVRRAALEPFGDAVLAFHVRGSAAAQDGHVVSAAPRAAAKSSAPDTFRFATTTSGRCDSIARRVCEIEAVNAALPPKTTIAYIRGVGDNVAPMLGQLGMKVTLVTPEELADADLSKYGAIVVGPRAFAASPTLAAQSKQAAGLRARWRNGRRAVRPERDRSAWHPSLSALAQASNGGAGDGRECAGHVCLHPGATPVVDARTRSWRATSTTGCRSGRRTCRRPSIPTIRSCSRCTILTNRRTRTHDSVRRSARARTSTPRSRCSGSCRTACLALHGSS